jgi:hypothetical protein
MPDFRVPLIIRGEVIEDYEVTHEDRSGTGRTFLTPDVSKYVDKLATRAETLSDLYTITLEDIYDYLEELSHRLNLDTNPYWREAYEVSRYTSNLSEGVLRNYYQMAGQTLSRGHVKDTVEGRIGSQYLEGWVPIRQSDGRVINVRAIGSRSIHIVAGNVPVVSVGTLMRSAITRNDAVIKAPSNDPMTAVALARTMIDMAPEHPITKHFSVGYWKGGDEAIESKLYRAHNFEKICAWGGYASIKHISKYLGPGLDLITLDPKNSATLVGRETFDNQDIMREIAARVAADVGGMDQEGCINTRVMFAETGTDAAGLEKANQFGQMIFDSIQKLPSTFSNGPRRFPQDCKSEIESILQLKEFYHVITDVNRIEQTGAVIVSQMDEQVDFPMQLYGRTVNLVPVDNIERALDSFSAATQTVGIYPPSLRLRLRDKAALVGGQMFQPIGYATMGNMSGPCDGVEAERRMCRWVVDSEYDECDISVPWE